MKLKPLFVLSFLYVSLTAHSQNIDSLLVVARTNKDVAKGVELLNAIAYYSVFNDTGRAHILLQEGKKRAIKEKLHYNYVELTNTEGVYYDVLGKRDSAHYFFTKAINLSKERGFTNLETRTTNNMGMLSWNQGKFNIALDYFFKALRLNETLPAMQKMSEATLNSNIGLIYQEMDMFDKALVYHNKAYELRKANPNRKIDIPVSLNNIGICYKSLGKKDLAAATYKEGLKVASENNNQTEYYKILENYSNLLMEEGQYTEAIDNYKKTLDRPAEIALTEKNEMFIYAELGLAYNRLRQPEKALEYAKKGLAIVEKDPEIKTYASDLYLALAHASYMLGNTEDGEDYNHEFAKLTSERFSADNASAMADMEVKYESEKKEKLIAEGKVKLFRAEAEARMKEIVIAAGQAELLKSEANSEKNEKLIAEGRIRLLKSEAEAREKEKVIAVNEAKLLKTEAEARQKNYMFMIALSFIVFLSVIGYLLFRQQRLKNRQLEKEFLLKSALAEIENQNRLQEQRLTISRDLHDNIGAQLTFIISSLDNLKYRLTENIPAVGTKLEGISNFTQQTIIELRDTIWAMNTEHITFEALRVRILNFMEKAREANESIDFKFKIDPVIMETELSSVAGMNIYRTIQEAVNNAIKHSGATGIEIIAFDEQDSVSIVVRDNGKGFDRYSTPAGNGLQNMEKRIDDMGGTFALTSAPGEGTMIEIHLRKQMQSA